MKHLLFGINLAVFIAVLRKRSILKPSIHLYSFCALTVFALIGSYASLWIDDWWLRSVSYENVVRAYYLFGVAYLLYGLSVYVVRCEPTKIVTRRGEGIERSVFPIILVSSFVISLVLIFPHSALLQLISHPTIDPRGLAEARGTMGVNNTDLNRCVLYFQNLVIRYLVVLVFTYYAIRYIRAGQNTKWFIISFCVCWFTSSLSLAKAPIVLPFLIILIVQLMYGRVNIFRIATVVSIVVVLIFALYVIVIGANTNESGGEIAHRVFISQYVGMPVVLEAFPSYHDYVGVTGLPGSVCAMLGREHVSYSRVAMEYANPLGVDNGVAGYLSTVSFAEGYAIGGVDMMFVSLLVVILYVIWLDRHFGQITSDMMGALYIVLVYRLSLQIVDGFTNFVLNYGLILCAVLVYCISQYNMRAIRRSLSPGTSTVSRRATASRGWSAAKCWGRESP